MSGLTILFVSHSFPPPNDPLANVGGMQRVAFELHAALRERSDVTVVDRLLCTSWKDTPRLTPPFMVASLLQIPRLVRKHRVDVVLFSSMVTASLSLLLRPLLPRHVRLTAIVHGLDVTTDVRLYQQQIVPRVFAALDLVMPVSRATAAACLQRGLAPDRVRVVPNGIDLSRFEAPVDRRPVRHELVEAVQGRGETLADDAVVLVSVGRQVKRKGFGWFIREVMPKLPPQVHYWLAGDGPERADLEAAVAAHGLQGRVRLLGMTSDETLRLMYRGADLFVMPNVVVPGDMEGFGVVMLEAGLSGLPIVASALEGILDVVVDGQNGHLVPTRDVEAFVEQISQFVSDEAGRKGLSESTARFTRSKFGWVGVADQYVQVLRALRSGAPLPD